MLSLAEESLRTFNSQFLGRKMEVLWEQEQNGVWSGHTGNYIHAFTSSKKILPIRFRQCG